VSRALAAVRPIPRRGLSREESVTDRAPVSGVYFIGFDRYIKIGRSNNIAKRIYSLQTSIPVDVIIYLVVTDKRVTESALHRSFKHLRLNGEWFKKTPELIRFIEFIRDESE
jgi:Meiotically up-regulated gene 113